ncbi:tumor necrosis factor receptor superfamily member 18 isoform X2 [Castor canadensis]|uniref:Tumor necrosis factor receptor superfamily member 18 isoform X2 n=1 Tax=Castor canadensis TaxID=51338 RepID=A0AC58N7U1_CASCN
MGAQMALCGVALLCALGLSQRPVKGASCRPGHFLRGSGTDQRCCHSCTPDEETCPEGDCMCIQPEFHCEDPQCTICKHHPCPPGQEARPHGREGRCRPWADCAQFGFLTMFPGNKTHNAVCILEPLPTEPHGQLTIMFLAVAICILVLTTAQLSLHIWQLRKQRMWSRETQPFLEVPLPPAEDACSCQFPEEERGERLEEKGRLGDRWM